MRDCDNIWRSKPHFYFSRKYLIYKNNFNKFLQNGRELNNDQQQHDLDFWQNVSTEAKLDDLRVALDLAATCLMPGLLNSK